MITILDYGMGNIGSLENMIRKSGGAVKVARSPQEIVDADKLILPGVGHFGYAMNALEEHGFRDILDQKVQGEKCPILCICLGAQLATEGSDEGGGKGLGWIKGRTVRFQFNDETQGLKLPHMGWNDVSPVKESRLFADMPAEPCFYFVHKFHFECDDPSDVLTMTHYGYDFVSGIERDNIYAVQFHPEKSHKYGFRLIKNFVEI